MEDHTSKNKKRVRDNSDDSAEVKRLREDLLGFSRRLGRRSHDSGPRLRHESFEEEIAAATNSCQSSPRPASDTEQESETDPASVPVVDLTSESGESNPDLGYLLEASDDELGLPPSENFSDEAAKRRNPLQQLLCTEQTKQTPHPTPSTTWRSCWTSRIPLFSKSRFKKLQFGISEKVRFCILNSFLCFCQDRRVGQRRQIAVKLNQLREKLSAVESERGKYGFNSLNKLNNVGEIEQIEQPARLGTTSLIEESAIYGRDEDKKVLMSRLVSESSEDGIRRNVDVIPVVWMGGMEIPLLLNWCITTTG